MTMESMHRLLEEHRFFHGIKPEYLDVLTGCASNVVFEAGAIMFREGDPAATLFLIRHGRVALELDRPGQGPAVIQTAGEGEGVGWSWLVGLHQWRYTGRAVLHTRAIALNGVCLRKKCEENHDLGYEMHKRIADVMAGRLEATRLQLLDLYATKP
jgi:CRP-like cAMP-binding protein